MYYRFSCFRLDPEEAVLTRAGERVQIRQKSFDILLYLVERNSRLVLYDDLIKRFWLDHDAAASVNDPILILRQNIRDIRKILDGDDGKSPRFIETVRGRGYRFIALVEREEPVRDVPPFSSPVLDETSAQIATLHHQLGQLDRVLGVSRQQELRKRVEEAVSFGVRHGYAAPETEEALILARHLCQEANPEELPQLYKILQGLCNAYLVKGHIRDGQRLAFVFCSMARRMTEPTYLIKAREMIGVVLSFTGQFVRARYYLERLLAKPGYQHDPTEILADTHVVCLGYLAIAHAALGYPDQARACIERGYQRAHGLSHAYNIAWICHFSVALYQSLNQPYEVAQRAKEQIERSSQAPFPFLHAGGLIHQGWAEAMQGNIEKGLLQLYQGIQAWRATGSILALPRWLVMLAQAYARTDYPEEGLPALEEAMALMERTGDRHYASEVYRMQGELLVNRHTSPEVTKAEHMFQHSLHIARRQQTRLFELRTTVSLARLQKSQGRHDEARALLLPIYNWFSEGLDAPDLQEARQLLHTLSH